jgi:hypothetical protein
VANHRVTQLAAMGMEERPAQAVGQIDAILAEDRAATDVIGGVRWTDDDQTSEKGTLTMKLRLLHSSPLTE